MPTLHDTPHHLRILGAMLLAVLAAGCGRPLALQHEFFSPMNGNADRIGAQARHAVSHQRALHAARLACDARSSAAIAPGLPDHARSGPNPGSTAAHEALADLCDTPARPPVAAHGATSNAYQRWVEDNVRELPSTSETAAGAAGGS